jgi:hypothetical protein
MKPSNTTIILATLLALAGSVSVQSQSNNVPGESDYNRFSQFIADRNIFDPNRQPRYSSGPRVQRPRTRPTRTTGTPYVSLVGTMNYDKGLFAFFDSNQYDLKQIIGAGTQFAGYTVKAITTDGVTLVDKSKREHTMKIGAQMHQDGTSWVLSDRNDYVAPSDSSTASDSSSSGSESHSEPAPSSNLENNDVLKRLMQLREKENQ